MNIAIGTLKAISHALIDPPFVFVLLWLTFVLYRMNIKVITMQKMIVGNYDKSAFELTISQIVLGILGGMVGSFILSIFGVVFKQQIIIELLFITSILLMLFKPRFICFSYSGAIVAALSIIIKILKSNGVIHNSLSYLEVDIVALAVMVAVLHIIEGILVMLNGKDGAIPVFTKKDNKIIGGFALKRYWPIPISILFMLQGNDMNLTSNIVSVPSFWHNFSIQSFDIIKNATIGFTAFYGFIGYSSVTFTKTKEEKAFNSGIFIMAFGVVLLILSYISKFNFMYQVMLVCLMPVLHEAMLKIQLYLEHKGEPKYISKDDGIMILEVAPNSPAEEMGIKSGDILVEINNKKIQSENDISEAISELSSFIWLKIKKVKGNFKEVSYNKMNSTKRLGIIFVPRGNPDPNKVMKFDTEKFKEVLDNVIKKDKKED